MTQCETIVISIENKDVGSFGTNIWDQLKHVCGCFWQIARHRIWNQTFEYVFDTVDSNKQVTKLSPVFFGQTDVRRCSYCQATLGARGFSC